MDKAVAAKTILRKRGQPETTVTARALEKPPREHRASLSEQVADSPIFINHWYWPGGSNKFPFQSQLKKVDVYFPYAKASNGKVRPLCIDFCETDEDVKAFQPKAEALKELGIKYLILRPKMTFNDAMIALGDD